MNKYMITAWTFTTVLVQDTEFNGIDVVIGTYEAENEDKAKQQASSKHKIPFEDLTANQIV